MPDRMFRLMERQQKLDGLIARARRARWVDPLEIARLNLLKQSLKERVARLLLQRQPTTHSPKLPPYARARGSSSRAERSRAAAGAGLQRLRLSL